MASKKANPLDIPSTPTLPDPRPACDIRRLSDAHRRLQDSLREAIKLHDQHGYHYYSPELCDAATHFDAEARRVGTGEVLNDRAEITATMTGNGTPYSEALLVVHRLFGARYTPMAVLKGHMPCHGNVHFIRGELEGVRRLLGPVGPRDLTQPQQSALRDWERELDLVECAADEMHTTGCQWLRSLIKYDQYLRDGKDLPTDRPTADYNDEMQVTSINGFNTLPLSAIREMQAAARSVFESASILVEPTAVVSSATAMETSKKARRPASPGSAGPKLIAALAQWHNFGGDGPPTLDPTPLNQLWRRAGVGAGSAKRFFDDEFNNGDKGGHLAYQVMCRKGDGSLKRKINKLTGDAASPEPRPRAASKRRRGHRPGEYSD